MISRYAFANARIGGMKSFLMEAGELQSMMEAPNLKEAISLLKNTYGDELSKLSSPSLVDIENVLTMSLVHDYEKIIKSVSGISRTFLEQYAKKLETSALKTIITMKIAGEKGKGEYPWILYRVITQDTVEKLLQMETLEEIIEMLKFTEYYSVLKKVAAEEGFVSAYPFITALDTYIYAKLGEIMQEMDGNDRELVRSFVGTEIDLRNLLTTFRLFGSSESMLWDSLIPHTYRLKHDHIRTIMNLGNIKEAPAHFPEIEYKNMIVHGLKEYEALGSLYPLEREFKRYILKMYRRVFYGSRFNISIPLAYLNLKENEIRNAVAILKGKEAGLPPEKIGELVLL